ncbi:MAG: hypothetical protein IT281_01255 [Ignavibacteria bacterium]|nr:hypothetical protein [Ignavibacteria bacterium]MCC7158148.1 hypothetical protein [Ignavibacteria bacterium]
MVKNSFLLAVLLILLITSFTYAQSTEITIPESGYTEICGKMLMIDGIWMSEGIIRADISILDSPNSKPITGGYKGGDEITISSEEGCTYYVFAITKSGLMDSKGTVVLSKYIPVPALHVCGDSLIFYETRGYKIDGLDWHVTSIKEGDGGKLEAEINITYNTSIIENLYLKENDFLWLGDCLYEVKHIYKSFVTSSDKTRKPLEGRISMTKISDYTYSTGPVIKGEDINKPIDHKK